MPWWINNPNSEGDSFYWFRWFQQIYRYCRGENRTFNNGGTLALTSATNLSDDYLYPCDATAAGFTVTLPLAANYQYKKFCIKKIDASVNVVTVSRSGSDTIDGATSVAVSGQYDSVVFISDGVSKWHVVTTGFGGGGGSDQNLFETIAVNGQDDVVADNTTDTLTLEEGHAVTITTDASTDTITIDAHGFNDWMFGNGADGVVHFNGTNTFSFATLTLGTTYTLHRPVYATNCIIDSGIIVQCFDYTAPGVGGGQQIYCQDTFTNNGLCGGNGQRNTFNLYVGGLGTPSGVSGIYLFGNDGGNGGRVAGPVTGRPGGNISFAWGGNGGAGGASSTPNAGGAAGVVTTSDTPPADAESGGKNFLYFPWSMIQGRLPWATSPFWQRLGGGAGGGGGGCVTGTVEGGAGGGGGGVFLVAARIIAAASGILSCDGAAGNVGSGGSGNGAGGGGGGGGGLLFVITTTSNFASILTCRAIGGAGGAQVGGVGVAGSAGSNGRVVSTVVF